MAVDVPVPRLVGFARVAAVPARLVLAAIVAASFAVRFVMALGHSTPLYFPDEYIYSAISRSLAEHGRPLIRGQAAHFPAMIEPLLAAPFWLTHDPELAYRLTQAENALAMSLAAIPVYLLMRRLGGGAWAALAAAALTVASPDLFFSSFVLADAIAYPLVLGAVYLAVCALSSPSRGSQLGFAALAVLATFTRIQYVFLPVIFIAAALVVERGSVRAVWRHFRLSVLLYSAPLAFAAVLGPRRLLGYYSGVADLHVRPGAIVHWLGTDSMLLAYAAGFALVPGALVGIVYALWRPRSREESGLAALLIGLVLGLFAEAAIYATNGTDRFQERYLMILLPLVFPAFWLWLRRGRPAPRVVAFLALGLLVLSMRVPLSAYTVSDFKQDSPFLLGIFRLEKAVGIGDGSLVVALVAAAMACVAAAAAFRARFAYVAVAATLVVTCAVSVAAVSFDHRVVQTVRATYLPPDARWIDHANLGPATLIQTPASPHARAHEHLFWNRSLERVMFLDDASPIDAFGSPKVRVAADGRSRLRRQDPPRAARDLELRRARAPRRCRRRRARSRLRALAPARHAPDGDVRRRPVPRQLARRRGPRHALARPQRPRRGDVQAPALATGRHAANRAPAPRPRREPQRRGQAEPARGRRAEGLAPGTVEAELPHEPSGLPPARSAPDQRPGPAANVQRQLLRHRAPARLARLATHSL